MQAFANLIENSKIGLELEHIIDEKKEYLKFLINFYYYRDFNELPNDI